MASKKGLEKLARVLEAVRRADEAALGACRARAAAARRQAARLRMAGRRVPGQLGQEANIVDLHAHGAWLVHTDRGARQADLQALAIDLEAQPIAARLAVTMGREQLVGRMIDEERTKRLQQAERRAEAEQMPYRSVSGI